MPPFFLHSIDISKDAEVSTMHTMLETVQEWKQYGPPTSVYTVIKKEDWYISVPKHKI